MTRYVRPPVEIATFRDAQGNPIPYGRRFLEDEGPPEDTYGTCLHPERFEPVVTVAAALVEFLVATYEVDHDVVVDGDRTTATFVPSEGTAMTITTSTADGPGVEVGAGVRYRGLWPDCGCDACDDDVADLLDDLEATVLTIAEGGFSEWRSGPEPSMPLVTDDLGRALGDEVVPWLSHVRFQGRLESQSSGWSTEAPEPVELPTEPRRDPAWPLRR